MISDFPRIFDACAWSVRGRFYVPWATLLVSEMTCLGPCNGSVVSTLTGCLKAPLDPFAIKGDTWILFQYVGNLFVTGRGIMDCQGPLAWPYNDCHKNPNCHSLATVYLYSYLYLYTSILYYFHI